MLGRRRSGGVIGFVFFPPAFEPDYFSLGLLQFLKWVYSRTSSPVVYYQCAMWGGGIEEETAWIMSVDERVYQHQDDGTVVEHTADDQRTVNGGLLQLAMRHVGLDLPTRFFALHEASFHWKLYRMHGSRGVGML